MTDNPTMQELVKSQFHVKFLINCKLVILFQIQHRFLQDQHPYENNIYYILKLLHEVILHQVLRHIHPCEYFLLMPFELILEREIVIAQRHTHKIQMNTQDGGNLNEILAKMYLI